MDFWHEQGGRCTSWLHVKISVKAPVSPAGRATAKARPRSQGSWCSCLALLWRASRLWLLRGQRLTRRSWSCCCPSNFQVHYCGLVTNIGPNSSQGTPLEKTLVLLSECPCILVILFSILLKRAVTAWSQPCSHAKRMSQEELMQLICRHQVGSHDALGLLRRWRIYKSGSHSPAACPAAVFGSTAAG